MPNLRDLYNEPEYDEYEDEEEEEEEEEDPRAAQMYTSSIHSSHIPTTSIKDMTNTVFLEDEPSPFMKTTPPFRRTGYGRISPLKGNYPPRNPYGVEPAAKCIMRLNDEYGMGKISYINHPGSKGPLKVDVEVNPQPLQNFSDGPHFVCNATMRFTKAPFEYEAYFGEGREPLDYRGAYGWYCRKGTTYGNVFPDQYRILDPIRYSLLYSIQSEDLVDSQLEQEQSLGSLSPQQRGTFDLPPPQQRGTYDLISSQQRGTFDLPPPSQQRGTYDLPSPTDEPRAEEFSFLTF